MNARTKWLLLGALSVFVLYFGDQLYRSQIEQPTNNLNAELDALTKKLQTNQETQAQAKSIGKRLESYAARSLPYDPQLARSAYQDWLLKLMETHAMKSASVDASQPRPIEQRSRVDRRKRVQLGHSISFTLRGQANLAQWAKWLNDFRNSGHLHKIQSVSLNPVGMQGQLDGNLSIEVLCLNGATRKDSLSDWQRQDSQDSQDSQDNPHAAYDQLVGRNLFAKGFAKSLFQIELKAITVDRKGRAQAWFRLDEKGTVQAMQTEQKLPIALHEISIVEILPNKVLIHVNQDAYWITLGQTVGELCAKQENS